jgi:hypothetical protein
MVRACQLPVHPFEYQSPTVALFIGVIKLTNDGDKLGLFIQRDIQGNRTCWLHPDGMFGQYI